jgi:hypothetical protein
MILLGFILMSVSVYVLYKVIDRQDYWLVIGIVGGFFIFSAGMLLTLLTGIRIIFP